MKNIAASVKARLLNLARLEGRDYNRLLVLWVQERLLARLAVSRQRENFILKGGLTTVLEVWQPRSPNPRHGLAWAQNFA
jgi:hypothetical protein